MIEVILVDEKDNAIGVMEKLAAHQQGLLHRAVTVYVFNSRGEMLLQQRATSKYHCGDLWSNTCCGHPFPNESTQNAAERRLFEELGLDLTLSPIFSTQYKLEVTDSLIEHEFGYIFFAISDQQPQLNPKEAQAWRYATMDEVFAEIARCPDHFTPWFKATIEQIPPHLQRFMANSLDNSLICQ